VRGEDLVQPARRATRLQNRVALGQRQFEALALARDILAKALDGRSRASFFFTGNHLSSEQ